MTGAVAIQLGEMLVNPSHRFNLQALVRAAEQAAVNAGMDGLLGANFANNPAPVARVIHNLVTAAAKTVLNTTVGIAPEVEQVASELIESAGNVAANMAGQAGAAAVGNTSTSASRLFESAGQQVGQAVFASEQYYRAVMDGYDGTHPTHEIVGHVRHDALHELRTPSQHDYHRSITGASVETAEQAKRGSTTLFGQAGSKVIRNLHMDKWARFDEGQRHSGIWQDVAHLWHTQSTNLAPDITSADRQMGIVVNGAGSGIVHMLDEGLQKIAPTLHQFFTAFNYAEDPASATGFMRGIAEFNHVVGTVGRPVVIATAGLMSAGAIFEMGAAYEASLGTLSTGGRALQTLSVGSGLWLSGSVAYSGSEAITGHDFYGNQISRMAAAKNAGLTLLLGKADVILPVVAKPLAGTFGRSRQMMANAGRSVFGRMAFFGRGVGREVVADLGRPFRSQSRIYPADIDLVNHMNQLPIDNVCFDCSEIADSLFKASGGVGSKLRITPKIKFGTIEVPELISGVIQPAKYDYHYVYQKSGYIYDPRVASSAIPKGDYFKLVRQYNPSGFSLQEEIFDTMGIQYRNLKP